MAGLSPTQLTLRQLREDPRFTQIEVVEKWVPHPPPGHRHDLFNIIDIIAIGPGITLAVQATSVGGMSARKKKLTEALATRHALEAGWLLELYGWEKKNNRWISRIHRFRLEQEP